MNLHLVRPPVAHLVFQLYAKPLHPELFDILATRKFEREDYQSPCTSPAPATSSPGKTPTSS